MSSEKINALAERLSSFSFVRTFDGAGEPQAGVLAHAIVDIQEATANISSCLLKLQQAGIDEAAARSLLLSVREELRHIIYHVKDTQFFSDVADQT